MSQPLVATVSPALPCATHWAALHTRARAEKVVAEWIAREGGTPYLPLARSRRVYGARVRESWVPLLPGYVFYDAGSYDGRRALRSHKVASVLVPPSPAGLGPDLENVARALAALPGLRLGRQLVEPGTRVEVVHGPLAGLRGRLVRRERDSMLVLGLDFLGFGAEVSIDEACVRAA